MKIDLLDPAGYTQGQPHEQFRWLRENDPVHWHEDPSRGVGFWALTRQQDVRAMLADPVTFSSSPSTSLDDSAAHGDEDHTEIIFSDPPRHTDHRKFLGPEFAPGTIKRFTDGIARVVDDILDEVIERGECDLVPDIAGKLASYSIAELMGLPRQDLVELYEATDQALNASDRSKGAAAEAVGKLLNYARATWADRSAAPVDDLVSRLAQGSIGDRKIDEIQFKLDLFVIINAGGDTTRNAFSGGMLELMQSPEQFAAVAADPSMVKNAVEEMLRWTSPIAYQRRTVTRDTEIAGQRIAAGQRVLSWVGAINRDPAVFANPETFDIGRSPNLHMTFGYGNHHCLGSHLAKLELNTMLRELLRRMPDIELAGPAKWLRDDQKSAPLIVGPKSIPVRFTPGPRIGPR